MERFKKLEPDLANNIRSSIVLKQYLGPLNTLIHNLFFKFIVKENKKNKDILYIIHLINVPL